MSLGTRTVHRELGLDDSDLELIVGHLGREPTLTELAMFSVMWSEHCSYRSSRVHLRSLPSEGPRVLVGPGEGAGVVEVAPGIGVAWKIESHNHPSFVEPHNGAATGVGGIVRDVVSMGGRPIALLDSLRLGPLEEAHSRYLFENIVGGISSYGNSIGVPTVGGECVFEDPYADNPLVNVACLGLIEREPMRASAGEPGNVVILFGSSTGRDGIGGASVLASAEFDENSAAKRPSVQVGDPFGEKLLIEASLELVARGLLVGFQDLGAGGISCPSSEMSAKAGTGMELDLDAVHLRELGMEPFEVMISESQERMMAVVRPADVEEVLGVCSRWGLEAREIGRVTGDGKVRVRSAGEVVAEVPAEALAGASPALERPAQRPAWIDSLQEAHPGGGEPEDLAGALLALLGSPALASKRWVWEQYDHMILLGTLVPPGGDAAVIRLPSGGAVALSLDGPGRICSLDPYRGAQLAVVEAARNVACTGAEPVAITDCLNLGNPTKPDVMWQLEEVVRGIGEACRALGTPVIGGNVSLYNETGGRPIHPTPVIGMLGTLPRPETAVRHGFRASGDAIVLLGDTDPHAFAGSEYSALLEGRVAGRPPAVDLEREKALVELLWLSAQRGLVGSAHDLAAGGLGISLAESAIEGDVGFEITLAVGEPHRVLFSESPARALLSCSPENLDDLLALADRQSIPATVLGRVAGARLDFGCFSVPLERAREVFEEALPSHLATRVPA